jgi:hypothetical protein
VDVLAFDGLDVLQHLGELRRLLHDHLLDRRVLDPLLRGRLQVRNLIQVKKSLM